MARRMDLIDQFTELVVGADDPRRLAERTLEVVMSLLNGRSSAVFTSNGSEVTLFASRGIDQAVLEIVPMAWAGQKDALRRGDLVYVPDRSAERRVPTVPADRPGPASFVVVPVMEEDVLLALLYVDSSEPHFCDAHDLERLAKFSRIVAKSVNDSSSPRPAARLGRLVGVLPRAHAGRGHGAREAAPAAEPERVEHRARRPHDGRHAPHRVPAPAALQHPARARPQVAAQVRLLSETQQAANAARFTRAK